MSPIAAKGEDKLVGFYIYLYNVFFLCLFACAAFFCGVTKGMTESKRFAYLSMLMALLALEGVADMGSSLVSGTFSSGGSFGPPWCFDPFWNSEDVLSDGRGDPLLFAGM